MDLIVEDLKYQKVIRIRNEKMVCSGRDLNPSLRLERPE